MAQPDLPMIPVAAAEMLYVAMDHVLRHVEQHGTYPQHMSDDMRRVMGTYNKVRTNSMKVRGYDSTAVRRYTEMAQRSLAMWLESRAAKNEELQSHFDRWTEELTGEQDDQSE